MQAAASISLKWASWTVWRGRRAARRWSPSSRPWPTTPARARCTRSWGAPARGRLQPRRGGRLTSRTTRAATLTLRRRPACSPRSTWPPPTPVLDTWDLMTGEQTETELGRNYWRLEQTIAVSFQLKWICLLSQTWNLNFSSYSKWAKLTP